VTVCCSCATIAILLDLATQELFYLKVCLPVMGGCVNSEVEEDPSSATDKLNKADAKEAEMEAEIMAMLNPTSGKAVSETMAFFIMPSSDGI
jgi:hypothetical protein